MITRTTPDNVTIALETGESVKMPANQKFSRYDPVQVTYDFCKREYKYVISAREPEENPEWDGYDCEEPEEIVYPDFIDVEDP